MMRNLEKNYIFLSEQGHSYLEHVYFLTLTLHIHIIKVDWLVFVIANAADLPVCLPEAAHGRRCNHATPPPSPSDQKTNTTDMR
jgi:hypothetical protein